MSLTVGLDFGTHQTKVCIEDATNPAQKIYEFFEFKNPFGKASVLFPSIVQINEDDTLSYGFVDEGQCKYLHSDGFAKPKLKSLQKPILKIPTEPNEPIFPVKPVIKVHSLKDRLQSLINRIKQKVNPEILAWEEECNRIRSEHKFAINEWKNKCEILQHEYQKKISSWENETRILENQYQDNLNEWGKKVVEKYYYRYFKLATFSNSIDWNHNIDSDIISVWYIAYILFTLQEKLGEDFFLQMGIPSGISQNILLRQKRKAFSILISAYKLVGKYITKENFLNEKYSSLIQSTELGENYSESDILFYGLNVVPEAFAGLSSITQQKRLETGMSLLVDIGGGTTDVAFFTIRENQPDIHSVISFPKGLNYIFENYIKQNGHLTTSEVQNLFLEKQGSKSLFKASINQYHHQLRNQVSRMVSEIISSFEFRKDFHQLTMSKLTIALENRPVVFCGGGAIYRSMQTSLLSFRDIKLINRSLLNIPFVRNQNINDMLYTILATSYGLSIPLENEIVLTPIEKIFNHIEAPEIDKWNDFKYDHGLSDF
jgi:hypothetical protein